tara:strand:+ start:24064 stop:24771 length:708 start_codon:yes stop_codon:yes gene_type:complete
MLKKKTLLSVLALAAFSGAALAQSNDAAAPKPEDSAQSATPDTSAPATDGAANEDAATGAATAEATPTDPTLDTGQAEAPGLGDAYVREQTGDWQIQCVKMEDPTQEPCQMYQLLRGDENNPVAEVIIEKLPPGGQVAAGATIAVPHGTALSKDLRVAVDSSQGKVYRYAFCDQGGCYARIGLLPADVAAFKKGNVATVTIFPFEAQDKPVELSLSLAGFTASYESTGVIAPPQQ